MRQKGCEHDETVDWILEKNKNGETTGYRLETLKRNRIVVTEEWNKLEDWKLSVYLKYDKNRCRRRVQEEEKSL